MILTRTVSWGDGLYVLVSKAPGGLKALVSAIAGEVGDLIGTRNTFGKLFDVAEPDKLPVRDQWRAWLLLELLGEDPADWGIYNEVVPASFDIQTLRARLAVVRSKGLEPPTFWSVVSALPQAA